MLTLRLGVVDIGYTDPDVKGAVTTGEVATFLEDEYHVMETFAIHNMPFLEEVITRALKVKIENVLTGKKSALSSVLNTQAIDARFRDYLDRREWKAATGRTIEAAEQGFTTRKKLGKEASKARPNAPKRKAGARQEFIDSGLYQAAFRTWID